MALPFDVSWAEAAFLAGALFVAAFVRGVCGFGFSAIFLILATLVVNPLPLIAVVFCCEIAMTLFQARGIRPHVDWMRTLALLGGAAIAVVPAVALMAQLDASAVRLAISAMILAIGLVLLSGWRLRRPVGMAGSLGVGVVAGVANSAGVGGLPAAAFLSAQPIPPAVLRAVMIVFLTGIDLMTLPAMAAYGLVSSDTLRGVLYAFPVLGLGVFMGTLVFSTISQDAFRRGVILFLVVLSVVNLMRVAFGASV